MCVFVCFVCLTFIQKPRVKIHFKGQKYVDLHRPLKKTY
jgi:hypothetical protein